MATLEVVGLLLVVENDDILNSLLAKLCYAMSKGSHLFTREFTAHKIMSKGRKILFDLNSSHILLLKHGKQASLLKLEVSIAYLLQKKYFVLYDVCTTRRYIVEMVAFEEK